MLASQVIILFAVSCSHARLCSTQSTSFLSFVVPSSNVHYNVSNILCSSINLLDVAGSPSTTICPMMVMHISAKVLLRTSYCAMTNYSIDALQITFWMSASWHLTEHCLIIAMQSPIYSFFLVFAWFTSTWSGEFSIIWQSFSIAWRPVERYLLMKLKNGK